MTTRILSLVLLSLMFFSACTKDPVTDNPPTDNPQNPSNNPDTYKPGKNLLIDDLVLYTSNGAHRDVNLIKNFMTRNFPDNVDKFYYDQTTVNDHKITQSLLFMDNNRVKLNGTTMEIVSKTATELILSPLDSTSMPVPDQFLGRCKELYDQVPQFNPYSICKTSGGKCKKYRKKYPVIISGNDYYVPILNYALVSNCSILLYSSSPMPNYFNKDIVNGMLAYNDTVLVQISRLPLSK